MRAVLDPDQMRTVDAHKHYNFETSGVAWHVESDGAAWIYVAITSPSYPLRHAAGLLRDLRSSFRPKAEQGLHARGEGALNDAMAETFRRLCAQYDDLASVDSVHATLAKVETVKVVMQDSIELALQNCVSLEAIDRKADDLRSQAGVFKARAKTLRSRMWWKKCKIQLLIAVIALTILGVIVVVILSIWNCSYFCSTPVCQAICDDDSYSRIFFWIRNVYIFGFYHCRCDCLTLSLQM